MPITSIPFSARKAGPYLATAGQTVFSFGFPVIAAGDLTVWRERAGVLTELLLTTHYTVSGAGEQGGGAVTLTSGALENDVIAIDGDITEERTSTFLGGTPFKAIAIDKDLNRLAIMVQELVREVGRSIRRVAVDDQAGSLLLPRDVTETTLLALNAAGEVIGLIAADFTGPPGDTGEPGRTVLPPAGAPAGGLGEDGDFYINVSVADLYGPKTAGEWGSPVSLIGPPGAGGGDVSGPPSAADEAIARFSLTSGRLIQNSGVLF